MGGYWKYDYPEAGDKVSKYISVREQLYVCQSTLSNRVNALEFIRQSLNKCKNDYLKGDYYDDYVNDADSWGIGLSALIGSFSDYLRTLSSRIDEVNAEILLWQSRVNLGRWIEIT